MARRRTSLCEPSSKRRRVFDKAYYDRFYGSEETRVTDAAETRRLGEFVFAYLAHLDVEVRQVLDVGCGIGLWKEVIGEMRPEAHYTGVEVSEYLCRKYGWRRGSVVDFRSRGAYDPPLHASQATRSSETRFANRR